MLKNLIMSFGACSFQKYSLDFLAINDCREKVIYQKHIFCLLSNDI